ncbi:hypothetical protein QL996_02525 [Planococcus sp. APC 4015]|nr:hypothetical protein [Planococcus sp. APC 4015]
MEYERTAHRGTESSFSIDRVESGTWVIRDLSTPSDDPRHVVACVSESDELGVEVVWVRAVPLPTRYLSVEFVVEDLQRWTTRRRSEPPNRIPRLAPLPRRAPRSRS